MEAEQLSFHTPHAPTIQKHASCRVNPLYRTKAWIVLWETTLHRGFVKSCTSCSRSLLIPTVSRLWQNSQVPFGAAGIIL